MKLLGFEIGRAAEQRAAPPLETIASSATYDEFMRFFGLTPAHLPAVTVDSALQVPAVACAVDFIGSCMGALPRHAYKQSKVEGGSDKIERVGGKLQRLINEAPNPEWSAYEFWKYLYTQRSTGGRGLAWIERNASEVVALWPMDPTRVTVKRVGFRKIYEFNNGSRTIAYEASEVVDLPYMLKADQLCSYAPIKLGEKAIQLSIAMNDYASGFFAGGAIPPMALEGPMPQGSQAAQRQAADIELAIKRAREANRPFFGMPPGHELKSIGLDPEKGQLVEARRLQVEEIARVYRLPPVFLQDLSRGTFSNTEQQDLNLVKHLIAQLARQCEDELNLKLFGASNNRRFVEHNLDGLQRGDLKSRFEALARGVQTALLTPNEARELDNRPPLENGDKLYIQGATVPLGTQPVLKAPANDPGNQGEGQPNA
jgi:HK97 family phage portal protein